MVWGFGALGFKGFGLSSLGFRVEGLGVLGMWGWRV